MPLNIVKNEKIINTYSLYIYGVISDEQWYDDEITPNMINEALAKAGDAEFIDVYINSPGGSVFAGHTMYNALKRHPALIRTYVDGIAASAASVILQAGDERVIAPNGIVMIHNPMGGSWGYADDMRKYADTLDKVKGTIEDTYLEKVNIDRDKLIELMDAETYMNADEAIKMGFVDSLTGDKVAIQNSNGEITINSLKIDKKKYSNIYKNSAKIKPFEPTPEPIDYSKLENAIAGNNVTLLESEIIQNELESSY
jgi:ATP-dependent Clp protease protease subunit